MIEYKELFQPLRIGNLMAKNRMALPPMILGEATPDGYVTPNMVRRYRSIAEGGMGIIVVEGVATNSQGAKGIGGLLAVNNNIQGLANIADEIKLRGTIALMQVLHCGRQALPEANGGAQPVSVSNIPYWMGTKYSPTPREASLEELEEIKREFVNAALLAENAGFDGIEVHCAHGYLLATFLSQKANIRTDKYGGDFLVRMQYPLEVVKAVRNCTSKNFIVGARISANYCVPGEPILEEMTTFAQKLEEVGIDYISVSGGTYESHWKQSPPCYIGRNINVEESEYIKKRVHIPVFVAGGICYPEEANSIVKEGKADVVCMGRAIFADPELPNKIKNDMLDEIRPCIRCNLEFSDTFKQHQARCSVNFQMGREEEYRLYPVDIKKKVMIVGGGVGGLEAARVAAIRGHEVDIYEKNNAIGGSLLPASAPKHKQEIGRLLRYYERQMELLDIKIHTNIVVDEALVKSVRPEVLIISTGALPTIPDIPGINNKSVLVGEDVLLHPEKTGDNIVVVGAGCVGIDLVIQLIEKNKHVVLVEMAESYGADLDVISWSAVKKLFDEYQKTGKLELQLNTRLKEIFDDCVVTVDQNQCEKSIEMNNLILALGYTPCKKPVEELRSIIPNTKIIGDALNARRIRQAIHEGFVAGYDI